MTFQSTQFEVIYPPPPPICRSYDLRRFPSSHPNYGTLGRVCLQVLNSFARPFLLLLLGVCALSHHPPRLPISPKLQCSLRSRRLFEQPEWSYYLNFHPPRGTAQLPLMPQRNSLHLELNLLIMTGQPQTTSIF